jgi:hypothetical protein
MKTKFSQKPEEKRRDHLEGTDTGLDGRIILKTSWRNSVWMCELIPLDR